MKKKENFVTEWTKLDKLCFCKRNILYGA